LASCCHPKFSAVTLEASFAPACIISPDGKLLCFCFLAQAEKLEELNKKPLGSPPDAASCSSVLCTESLRKTSFSEKVFSLK
jgi:hypothetical protein